MNTSTQPFFCEHFRRLGWQSHYRRLAVDWMVATTLFFIGRLSSLRCTKNAQYHRTRTCAYTLFFSKKYLKNRWKYVPLNCPATWPHASFTVATTHVTTGLQFLFSRNHYATCPFAKKKNGNRWPIRFRGLSRAGWCWWALWNTLLDSWAYGIAKTELGFSRREDASPAWEAEAKVWGASLAGEGVRGGGSFRGFHHPWRMTRVWLCVRGQEVEAPGFHP